MSRAGDEAAALLPAGSRQPDKSCNFFTLGILIAPAPAAIESIYLKDSNSFASINGRLEAGGAVGD